MLLVTKGLVNGLVDLETRRRVETIQTKALLRSSKILRRVQETWGDLSLRFQRKTISLRWYEKLSRSKIKQKQREVLGPCQRTKDTVEHDRDGYTNCNWSVRNGPPQRLVKGVGRVRSRRRNREHSNYSLSSRLGLQNTPTASLQCGNTHLQRVSYIWQ